MSGGSEFLRLDTLLNLKRAAPASVRHLVVGFRSMASLYHRGGSNAVTTTGDLVLAMLTVYLLCTERTTQRCSQRDVVQHLQHYLRARQCLRYRRTQSGCPV
jgi:hypothetical protein